MVMESIFAVVDIFWVAKLGAAAVATVALTESMMAIVYTLAFGLAIGTTATVARRIGEKNADGAANAAVQAIALGLAVSLSLGALGAYLAPDLLRVMGAGPDVMAEGTGFARHAGRQCQRVHAVRHQRRPPRGGDAAVDAGALVRQCAQHRAWSAVHRPRPVSGVGCDRCGRGDHDRPERWRRVCPYHLLRGAGHIAVHREHLKVSVLAMGRLARLCAVGTFQILISTAAWIGLIRIIAPSAAPSSPDTGLRCAS